MEKDYYYVLGVSKGADLEKIKGAYRLEVKKYHPDKTHTEKSAERFMEIKEAYETLRDKKKRQQYDQELSRQGSKIRISDIPETVSSSRSFYNRMDEFYSSVDEFFSGFVPGFFERSLGTGKNLYVEVILSPMEASNGCVAPITVNVVEPCSCCSKTGIREDFFCPVCLGNGRIQSEREFSLVIPPRVNDGTEVRVSMEDNGRYWSKKLFCECRDPY